MSAKPKVVVVMPAYNAEKTLHMTYAALPHDIVDLVILVDDGLAAAANGGMTGCQMCISPCNRPDVRPLRRGESRARSSGQSGW